MCPERSPHLPTEACSTLINMSKECHKNHSVLKFFGHCQDLEEEVSKCLKDEDVEKRTRSREHGNMM
ncbi:COX assembly mitochondrial protein 2 homolog [Echinops telfairi]|uniref:COX assembly mitochondrial protein 2 homolog n=1 Tax=Echinops telfairi TaxID=9371 RepID=A0AC55DRF0_ECHTE|nr:COX assembly mitochondrial protein 2 homolog [Echinops telfairi]